MITDSRRCVIPIPIVPKARPRVHLARSKFSMSAAAAPAAPVILDAHMPPKYRRCISQIGMLLTATYGNDRNWPKDASYGIDLEVYVHSSMDGDVDNLLGTIMDAGNGIVWKDDRQVQYANVCKSIVPSSTVCTAELIVTVLTTTGFEPKAKKSK